MRTKADKYERNKSMDYKEIGEKLSIFNVFPEKVVDILPLFLNSTKPL